MGAGIAQTAAVGGFDVTLSDVAPRQLEQAVSGIEASLAKLTEKGRLDEATRDAALERIQTAAEPADADLLIEAATENVELKLRIFGAAGRGWPGRARSSRPTPARSRSPGWPRPRSARSGSSACTS